MYAVCVFVRGVCASFSDFRVMERTVTFCDFLHQNQKALHPGHHVLLTQTNPKMHHQHEENSFEDACHAHRMQGILGCGQCTVSKSDIAALSNGATCCRHGRRGGFGCRKCTTGYGVALVVLTLALGGAAAQSHDGHDHGGHGSHDEPGNMIAWM